MVLMSVDWRPTGRFKSAATPLSRWTGLNDFRMLYFCSRFVWFVEVARCPLARRERDLYAWKMLTAVRWDVEDNGAEM